MFEQLLGTYIESARPFVENAGRVAVNYAEQAVALLREIRDNGIEDDIPRHCVPILLPVAGSTLRLGEVPAGEVWELEAFTIATLNNPGVAIYANGSLRHFSLVAQWGFPPPPVRFMGPCTITADQTAVVESPAYVQFRTVIRRPRPTHAAGQREAGLSAIDAQREHDPLHLGLFVPAN